MPNRYCRSRVSGSGLTAMVETRLEPVGDTETDLTLRWVGTGTNLLTRILLLFMKRRIAERADCDLEPLRRLAEDPDRRRVDAGYWMVTPTIRSTRIPEVPLSRAHLRNRVVTWGSASWTCP